MAALTHNIIGTEAFDASRHGARLASFREHRRIEVEPKTADRIMLALALVAVAFGLVASFVGAL